MNTSFAAEPSLAPGQPWDIGTGVAGRVWRAASPRGIILLQHGFAEHAERFVTSYSRLIPRLVASGFDIYAFDFRGHGLSASLPGAMDATLSVEDHLAARRAIPLGLPLVLFGHSLGGMVTAGSLARDPSGVAAVVLSSPALPHAPLPLRLVARVIAGLAPNVPMGRRPPQDGLSRIDTEVRRFAEDATLLKCTVPMSLASSSLQVMAEVWAACPRWTMPTLIFHGTDDPYTDPAGSERLVQMIGSSDKTFDRTEGGRHELLNDIGREDLLMRVLAWIDQRV